MSVSAVPPRGRGFSRSLLCVAPEVRRAFAKGARSMLHGRVLFCLLSWACGRRCLRKRDDAAMDKVASERQSVL